MFKATTTSSLSSLHALGFSSIDTVGQLGRLLSDECGSREFWSMLGKIQMVDGANIIKFVCWSVLSNSKKYHFDISILSFFFVFFFRFKLQLLKIYYLYDLL